VSLPAGEQRALHAIEGALAASEPRMTAMFAMFTKLTRDEEPTGVERLSRRHPPRPRLSAVCMLVPALTAAALLVTLVVGLVTSGLPVCGTTAAWHGPRSAASCTARMLPLGRR
jgi:Protein of unknown function (DUF3040)